jgi:hypothetical protein
LADRYRIQLPMAWRLALSGYAIIKAFSRRGGEISWLIYMLAVVLVLYCVFVRAKSVRPTTDLGNLLQGFQPVSARGGRSIVKR